MIPNMNVIINDYDMILDRLYLGNYKSPELYGDKVSLIINCTKDLPLLPNNNIRESIRIPINDDPSECDNLLQFVKSDNILDLIHSTILNGESVLVHCKAGAQRSCAVVALYLIKYYNLQPHVAIQYIKKKRPIAFFGHVNFMQAIGGTSCPSGLSRGTTMSPSTPSGLE
jgi:hypothetical protein